MLPKVGGYAGAMTGGLNLDLVIAYIFLRSIPPYDLEQLGFDTLPYAFPGTRLWIKAKSTSHQQIVPEISYTLLGPRPRV